MNVGRFAMLLITVLGGCSSEYPSCPVETEQDSQYLPPEGGEHDPPPDDLPGPGWPSGDGLAADEGYKRLGDGQICRCKLGDDELCSRSDPSAALSSDGTCTLTDPEDSDCPQSSEVPDGNCPIGASGDPDCAQAEPQTPSVCGEYYWCCFAIECVGYATRRATDIPICPASYDYMQTRYMAYVIWKDVWVTRALKKYKKEYGTKACYVTEANCRANGGGSTCGKYPAD